MTIRIFDLGDIFEHGNYDVTFTDGGWLEVTVYGEVSTLPWIYASSVEGEIHHHAFHIGFHGTVRGSDPSTERSGSTPIGADIFPKDWWAIG